jgi:hypothetical protein
VGGSIGLVIALMTLARVWLWRETLIGGPLAWRGENGWRMWLCVYLELFGLGLMFGSFMLARTDIRVNPVLRRVLYGYNAIFTGLLLIAFLTILNLFVNAVYPMTYDWSSDRGVYSISESTKGILEKLKQPTTVYVLLSPRGRSNLYKDTKTLLDNCRTVTDKLTVQYVSPDSPEGLFEYDKLARRYPELLPDAKDVKFAGETDLGRGLLIVYGQDSFNPREKTPPNAFIAARKLSDEKRGFRGEPSTYQFLGEKVLRSELKFLSQGKAKIKVYFLQGNEELDINRGRPSRGGRYDLPMSFLGANFLVDKLRNENYDVQGLSFAEGKDDPDMKYVKAGKDKTKDIPEDASIVVLAGPSSTIPKTTLDALDRYLQKNGRLMVLFDVVVNVVNRKYSELKTNGMEEFLKKYNVTVNNQFLYRFPIQTAFPDPALVIALPPRDSANLLASKYLEAPFPLKSVRVVRPGTESPNYRAETILEVRRLGAGPIAQEGFWAEDNLAALEDPLGYREKVIKSGELEGKLSREPIPVAVAVKDAKEDKPRIVVYGDAEFASNNPIAGQVDRILVGDTFFNLFVSTLDYLADRPGVGTLPKPPKIFTLGQSVPTAPLAYLPAWLMFLGIFGLGLGMWVVRRR